MCFAKPSILVARRFVRNHVSDANGARILPFLGRRQCCAHWNIAGGTDRTDPFSSMVTARQAKWLVDGVDDGDVWEARGAAGAGDANGARHGGPSSAACGVTDATDTPSAPGAGMASGKALGSRLEIRVQIGQWRGLSGEAVTRR